MIVLAILVLSYLHVNFMTNLSIYVEKARILIDIALNL